MHANELAIICDPEDRDKIYGKSWQLDPDGRIRTNVGNRTIRLHQVIMPGYGMLDHKNGNQADVRKENLRPATHVTNGYNRGKTKANTSGYKGVFKHPTASSFNPWFARIVANHLKYHLGFFATAEEAAIAYDTAARKYHGEFARTNFIEEDRS